MLYKKNEIFLKKKESNHKNKLKVLEEEIKKTKLLLRNAYKHVKKAATYWNNLTKLPETEYIKLDNSSIKSLE